MIKVGIDLSTTNTGIVVIDDNGNYLMRLEKLWQGDYQETLWQINNVAHWLNQNYGCSDVIIGIELANFKNAKLTSKFNLLAGMIMGVFNEKIGYHIEYKLFNANEWHRLIGLAPKDERGKCKMVARVFAATHGMGSALKYKSEAMVGGRYELKNKPYSNKDFVLSDDLTDAYCIAYLLPKLRDNQQITQEVKQKKANDKQTYKQQMRNRLLEANKRARLNEIIKRYEILLASGKRLTKAQQNAYEKAKRGLDNER